MLTPPCLFLLKGFLLAGDRLALPFPGSGIGPCALTTKRQAFSVTKSSVRADIHEALDIHLHLRPQRPLDFVLRLDDRPNFRDFLIIEFRYPFQKRYSGLFANATRS